MREPCPYPTEYDEPCDYGPFETDWQRSDFLLSDHAAQVHLLCACRHQRMVHRDDDGPCVECYCGGFNFETHADLPTVRS
jgi:hypothetical protein